MSAVPLKIVELSQLEEDVLFLLFDDTNIDRAANILSARPREIREVLRSIGSKFGYSHSSAEGDLLGRYLLSDMGHRPEGTEN